MGLSPEHIEAYRRLGAMDWEYGQTMHPDAALAPVYGDGLEEYRKGYDAARRKPRAVFLSRSQAFERMMERAREKQSTKPLTKAARRRKEREEDW